MQIVPALYIKDGKPAAYTPGEFDHIDFLDFDPYDLIAEICKHKVQRIYLVDMDASGTEGKNNRALITSLANTTVAEVEAGGGITNMDYLKSLKYAGVDYFVIGSAAFENQDFLKEISEASHVDNDEITISLDLLDGRLTCHGWTQPVDDQTMRSLIQGSIELGFSRFICTDIDTTHPNNGPDILFYKELVEQFPDVTFLASGHINNFQDVEDLRAVGIKEVIVGNEIYKDLSLLDQISEYNERFMNEDD